MDQLTAIGVVSAGAEEHILAEATLMEILPRQIAQMLVIWLTTSVMKVQVVRPLIILRARKL